MKSLLLSALVALSIGLNALLLVGLTSPGSVAPLTSLLRPAATPSGPADPAASVRPRTTPGGSAAAAAPANWADLKSDDPATLVANLRAAGFSEIEIRGIVSWQLNQKVMARRRELAGPPVETPWWRNPIGLSTSASLITNPQAQAELRAMNQANSKLLESLLGPAPAGANLGNALERMQFGELPADKVEQLRLINSDYNDLISAIQIGAVGAYFPEDRARLKVLNEEKDKDIRAVLTPEEYDLYLLRSSNTANNMRSNLAAFNPTEEEFRRIFAVQYPFDQQYNQAGGMDIDLARQRAQAQGELTAQIKAVLDPARVPEYEQATDGMYRQAVALVSRLELPKENAAQLWQFQKDTQQRMTAIRTDRTLDVAARNQALQALQQEATSRASGLLGGQRGLDAYKVNGGQWLQNIVPPPPPPPGAAGGGGGGGGGGVIINGGTIIRSF